MSRCVEERNAITQSVISWLKNERHHCIIYGEELDMKR